MRKILLLLTAAFFFQVNTNAQKIAVSGRVVDSISKNAIEYATITLSDAKTNKILNGTTTDSTGHFKISDVDTGTYNVSFEFIGYDKKLISNLHVSSDKNVYNVGRISIHKIANALQDVVVTAQTKLIENRIDKIVYNAENDITSQGGVATDVLKKVPQVSIDADGNVELAGSSGIAF